MEQQLQKLSSDVACLLHHKGAHATSYAPVSDHSEGDRNDPGLVRRPAESDSVGLTENLEPANERDCPKDTKAGIAAGDWQQHMTDALEKALGHRLDSLAHAIVKPLQEELRQLVTVLTDHVHPDVKTSTRGQIGRTNTGHSPPRASPAYSMPSPGPPERAEFSEQGREVRNCCNGDNVQEASAGAGNPSSRGRRRRMTLAAGHSVILTDRFHRHAATSGSVPQSCSPGVEDVVSADHLAAAVAVMAEASSVAPTDGSGWPRRISSRPSTEPEEQEGAIYCNGGGGIASGTKHLLSTNFFGSPVIEKKMARHLPVDGSTDTPLQLAGFGHPLSVLSPAAAEAAFVFGVALAREEELQSQSSSAARALWQSMNQEVASNPSSWQRSSKPMEGLSTVIGSHRVGWRNVPSPRRLSPSGEIGWMQSAP